MIGGQPSPTGRGDGTPRPRGGSELRSASRTGSGTLGGLETARAEAQLPGAATLDSVVSFWSRHLADAPPLTEVIPDRPRSAGVTQKRAAGKVSIAIPPDVARSVSDLAREYGGTLANALLVAWQVLLARYSRAADVVVGCAVTQSDYMPVRLELPGNPEQGPVSIREVVAGAVSVHTDCLRHAVVPWTRLSAELAEAEPGGSYQPVFQCLYTCNDSEGRRSPPVFAASAPQPVFAGRTKSKGDDGTCDFDLELHVESASSSEGISATLLHRTALFDHLSAAHIAEHFRVVCEGFARNPGQAWYEVPLMTQSQQLVVVDTLNDTSTPYPHDSCLHDLFELQAAENPQRPCIWHEDAHGAWWSMSYEEVYSQAMAVAEMLRMHDVGPDVPVPLLMERTPLQVIAIYGVLLAGGFYVPIDVDYPSDRIMAMLVDCGAQQMLTDSQSLHLVPTQFSGRSSVVDELVSAAPRVCAGDVGPRRRRNLSQSPDTNVYAFYTSGTTGAPKGVEVTHRGLVKRAQWLQDFYPLSSEDRMIYKTPYTFGISEWELFWPMPYGAQLVLCKEGGQKNPEYLLETTVRLNVTVCTYVPSMIALLIEHMISEQKNYTTNMRHVICCGEALPIETCVRFFEVFDPDSCRLHNLYGPTEADMTFWECPKLHPGEPMTLTKIPIGRPQSNVKVYILDAWGNPVPPGVPGELHFGGVTTARGYLGMPELTAEKFVRCPFAKGRDCDRMYRTGDCARWLPDLSNIEFLGRIDNQVKLRGFRIELGEIESVLVQCEGVSKAAVILHGREATAKLVAYVEPAGLDVEILRESLKKKVPQYMVPDVIMALEAFPLTSRGKLDRKALPEPRVQSAAAKSGKGRPAETDLQKVVEAIWQEVLELTGRPRSAPIDIDTNFLSLGGNSLLAGRVTTKVRQQTKAMIPSTAMYQHPTIEKIANLCEQFKAPDVAVGETVPGSLGKKWGGVPGGSPSVVLWKVLGLVFDSFASTAAFLPGFMYVYTVYLESGRVAALSLLPFVMAATVMTVVVYSIAMKWLFLGNTQPGQYPVWGGFYLRWWFVGNLVRSTLKMLHPLVGGTYMYNAYLRLLGAKIGSRVVLDTDDLFDPELMTIDHDVEVCKKATIVPHSIENGVLSLWPVHIRHHAIIQPAGWVVPGTVVDPGHIVGALSTTGGVGEVKFGGPATMSRTGPSVMFEVLRAVVGVPALLAVEVLAIVPAIFALEWLWAKGLSGIKDEDNRYVVLYLLIPWIEKLVVGEAFFLATVLFKWVFIGRFKPGRHEHSTFHEFACWMLERLTHNQHFRFATLPWINTELLAIKYRMLGVKMGFKVQTDYFEILEYDLLSVGGDSVFGSNVSLCPSDHVERRRIVLQKGSQVLDHSTLMPGCVVGSHALCGSSTVGAKFHKFPPLSISTGNQGGRAVQLRVLQGEPDSAESLSHLPPAEKKMAMAALRAHKNNFTWGMFNLFNVTAVMLIAPLPAFADLLTVLLWFKLDSLKLVDESTAWGNAMSWALIIAITPPCYLLVQIVESIAFIGFKWLMVGTYKEGNFAFYGQYHRRWVIMMAVKEAIGKLLSEIQGTIFTCWFFRAMGSSIGKDVCIMGYGLEYDLFSAGDYSSIGVKCDVTCHTVENMVIKLAPTRLESQCTMRAGALVQPGGVMKNGAVILENSQLLKGGQAEENSVYRGLPAEPIQRVRAELEGERRLESYVRPLPADDPAKHRTRRWQRIGLVIALMVLGCIMVTPGSSQPHAPMLITLDGPIQGARTSYGTVYRGIPYAQPPVGPLRFAPPVPATPWRDTLHAPRRRDSCVTSSGGSEDCLYLDVTVPRSAGYGRLLPVVYWLHGGCFSESWVPGYDGRAMQRFVPDAIVVTASHRIGALGFMSSRSGNATFSNFGLLDQRAVLEWIARNIEVFRGDPSRVTIFGQGSGAASVAAHLVMQKSWGLFQGAVMQSASAVQLHAHSLTAALDERKQFAKQLGCGDKPNCLRDASAQSIAALRSDGIGHHSAACAGSVLTQDSCQWGPVMDGAEITDHPWRLMEQGRVAAVPVIIGWRVDDGGRGIDHSPSKLNASHHDDPGSALDSEHLREGAALYPSQQQGAAQWFTSTAARTDLLHMCPARRFGGALRTGARYLFVGDQGTSLSHVWFQRGSKHTVEEEPAQVPALTRYVRRFIASGTPDGEPTAWPAFTAEGQQVLRVPANTEAAPSPSPFPSAAACALWDKHWVRFAECDRDESRPVARDPGPPR